MTVSRRALIAMLPAALAACSTVLTGGGDPPALYRLNARSGFADLLRVEWQLEVPQPEVPQGLNSVRIALRRSPVSLEYYGGVNWTDPVPELVQTVLVRSFENSGRIAGVSRDALHIRPDYLLATELRDFQADYEAATAPPQVTVQLTARLIRLPDRAIVASQTFAHRVRADGTPVERVVLAFDAAIGEAARQVVEWTLRAAPPARPVMPGSVPPTRPVPLQTPPLR